MIVKELITILQRMPQDSEVEVNDNGGGQIWAIEGVDDFSNNEDGAYIIIQINCE